MILKQKKKKKQNLNNKIIIKKKKRKREMQRRKEEVKGNIHITCKARVYTRHKKFVQRFWNYETMAMGTEKDELRSWVHTVKTRPDMKERKGKKKNQQRISKR